MKLFLVIIPAILLALIAECLGQPPIPGMEDVLLDSNAESVEEALLAHYNPPTPADLGLQPPARPSQAPPSHPPGRAVRSGFRTASRPKPEPMMRFTVRMRSAAVLTGEWEEMPVTVLISTNDVVPVAIIANEPRRFFQLPQGVEAAK